MSSRSTLLSVLAVVLSIAACRGLSTSERARPNIVLLMTDDQGWGDLGHRGHPRLWTPHMDTIAAEGVQFERFYASSPVCSPTRASVLTGRHPFRMGIRNANVGHLPAEEHALAELLGAAGYATGHFGKWHLGTLTTEEPDSNRGGPAGSAHFAPPWEHGFETCFSTEAKVPTLDPMVTPPHEHGGVRQNQVPGTPFGTAYWTGPGDKVTAGLEGDDSALIVDRALAFIDRSVREERPFLAVIWFHAPHLPVVASPEAAERFADLPLRQRHFLGCLEAADTAVGRLRTHLAELGIEQDTLLWFTSDNGPEGGPDSGLGSTGPFRGRKRSLHEGGVRVPGMLAWPGHLEPRRLAAPCGTVDILPTVLGLLDLPAPSVELDGVDLGPLLRGEREHRGSGMGFLHGGAEAWSEDRWKLLRTGDGPFALYDLEHDLGEAHDLASERPDVVRRLADELAVWRARVEDSKPASSGMQRSTLETAVEAAGGPR
jgi:arylsulfatase A-like enzyme